MVEILAASVRIMALRFSSSKRLEMNEDEGGRTWTTRRVGEVKFF
jgi:hypothetical protein